jgi:hypothetical protein
MTTTFIDDGRGEKSTRPRFDQWTANLLLVACGVMALVVLGGDGLISTGILSASFWALVGALTATALILFWRALRLLRTIHR